jgi:translation elongation factor EF-G
LALCFRSTPGFDQIHTLARQRLARLLLMARDRTRWDMRAEVPLAEIPTCGTALTSMTQGQGSFRLEMDHYDIAPHPRHQIPNPSTPRSGSGVRYQSSNPVIRPSAIGNLLVGQP